MKIIFMGTSNFSVTILKKLIKHHNILAVVTMEDKAKGRGKKILSTPVKDFAKNNNLQIMQPSSVIDVEFIDKLRYLNADLFVVASYGKILPEQILEIAPMGCINVHASILPDLRGAAPIQYALIRGYVETGVTIMKMDEGMDTGDILYIKKMPILAHDNYQTLHDKLSILGSDAIIETLNNIKNILPIKQDNDYATYAPMIKKTLGHINYSNTTKDIINLVRGLTPKPGGYSYYKDELLKIYLVNDYPISSNASPAGTIIGLIKEGIVVKTGDGALLIKEIQRASSKKLNCSDFLRGYKIEIGEFLL
jgi:methionyl-tRNA formyltransferase